MPSFLSFSLLCYYGFCSLFVLTSMFSCSSGKCQIIHWRHGHKDECCPPIATMQLKEESVSHRAEVSETQPGLHGNGFDWKLHYVVLCIMYSI